MRYIVCLLALLPAAALANEVVLRPGECIWVHQTRVCAAHEHVPVQHTTVVYMPAPTPAPRNVCLCQYGMHPTEGDAPMRGYWLMRDGVPVVNFLADSKSCQTASKSQASCLQ